MTSPTDTITFNNGLKMPCIGLGTYAALKDEVAEAVTQAIDIGYRLIDTASYYCNEYEVGKAIKLKIKEGVIKREDIFVITKVWNNRHKEKSVIKSCKDSLDCLGLDYIDLLLIHWPFAFQESKNVMPMNDEGEIITDDTDYLETWRGMEECVNLGYTRSIGLSNFNSEQITRLLENAKIKPVNNQIECSVNINQTKLIEFCKKHDITVTGYSPLGAPGRTKTTSSKVPDNIFLNPAVVEIAKKHNKLPAQVAIRFVMQQGAVPIPKSINETRLKQNIDVFDFKLSEEDMTALRKAETGVRVASFSEIKEHKYYPFNIEF